MKAGQASRLSGQEIERIRQLEGALGVTPGEIARLVADVGEDREALPLDRFARGTHERAVVLCERFDARIAEKAAAGSDPGRSGA